MSCDAFICTCLLCFIHIILFIIFWNLSKWTHDFSIEYRFFMRIIYLWVVKRSGNYNRFSLLINLKWLLKSSHPVRDAKMQIHSPKNCILYVFVVFADNFRENQIFRDDYNKWTEFDLLFNFLIVSRNIKDAFNLSGLLEQDDNWIFLAL